MRSWIIVLIVAAFLLQACESQNCDELGDDFFNSRDDCWTEKAVDAKDTSICVEKVEGPIDQWHCFSSVAQEAKDVGVCAEYFAYLEKTGNAPVTKVSEYDVCVMGVAEAVGDVNICAQHLKDKKGRMDQCAQQVNAGQSEKEIEACKKLSEAKQVVCLTDVAIKYKQASICLRGVPEAKGVCLVAVAEELDSAQSIIASTVAGEERDLLLATYTMATLNDDGLASIQDPRVYDGAMIMVPISAYVDAKKVPTPTYCDNLKGGYSGEYADDDFEVNKNLCEGIVAAFNELRDGGDACNNMLSARIRDEDNLADAKENCASFVSQYRTMEQKVAEANTPEEYEALLKELGE